MSKCAGTHASIGLKLLLQQLVAWSAWLECMIGHTKAHTGILGAF